MTTIDIETRGFEKVASATGRSRVLMLGGLNRMLRRAGKMFVPALKANTPVRTGKLRASTRYQVVGSAEDMRMEVRQGARTAKGVFYRPFVTDGTRAHEIRPLTAKALRFEIGGKTVFAKKVRHPGTKPNPYHELTVRQKMPELQRIADQEAEVLAQRLLD